MNSYAHNGEGRLAELTHRDREGILDRYVYQYDLMGNKTAIEKQRRGLPGESGAYTYNAMNQLVSRVDAMNEEPHTYDKRGNLSLILQNGALRNQYVYGALNCLEQAVNAKGETALYTYNGLGHRVGKTIGILEMQGMAVPDPLSMLDKQGIHPEKKIQYTIDLTRGYHNLLQKEEDGKPQSYLWDRNMARMREDTGKEARYYLQDELGSPIRLTDQNGELEESYGYDEHGKDLYGNQGVVQPFGYTGYQPDRIAGTCYAQAREYMPLNENPNPQLCWGE